jgi:hypothetical protein
MEQGESASDKVGVHCIDSFAAVVGIEAILTEIGSAGGQSATKKNQQKTKTNRVQKKISTGRQHI